MLGYVFAHRLLASRGLASHVEPFMLNGILRERHLMILIDIVFFQNVGFLYLKGGHLYTFFRVKTASAK